LPGRRNVVVTRQADYMADGATVVGGLDEVAADDEMWVIGGGHIYTLALPIATRCEVTEVEVDLPREDDDVVAPVLDEAWAGIEGDWMASTSGLRYRVTRYHSARSSPPGHLVGLRSRPKGPTSPSRAGR